MKPMDRSNQKSFAHQADKTITIDLSEVRANDFILIRTRNSLYSFLITDAVEMRGKLSGGPHLSDAEEAVLVKAIFKCGRKLCDDSSSLRMNSRALFLVPCGSEMKELLTSPITKLVVVRSVVSCLER